MSDPSQPTAASGAPTAETLHFLTPAIAETAESFESFLTQAGAQIVLRRDDWTLSPMRKCPTKTPFHATVDLRTATSTRKRDTPALWDIEYFLKSSGCTTVLVKGCSSFGAHRHFRQYDMTTTPIEHIRVEQSYDHLLADEFRIDPEYIPWARDPERKPSIVLSLVPKEGGKSVIPTRLDTKEDALDEFARRLHMLGLTTWDSPIEVRGLDSVELELNAKSRNGSAPELVTVTSKDFEEAYRARFDGNPNVGLGRWSVCERSSENFATMPEDEQVRLLRNKITFARKPTRPESCFPDVDLQ